MKRNSNLIKKIIFSVAVCCLCFSFASCGEVASEREKMDCPVGLELDGDKLKWLNVEGATSYKVYINGELAQDNVTESFYSLGQITQPGIYILNVVANGVNGKNDSVQSIPVKYIYDRDGILLSAGEMHSVYLDIQGKIWGWGDNTFHQIDESGTSCYDTPVEIVGDRTFVAVSAGGYHTLALDREGNIWSWGDNSFGQLGRSSDTEKIDKISSDCKFKAISAGGTHSLAVDTDGNIWAWGNAQNGRCGNGEAESVVWEPVRITEQICYSKVSAGGMHSLALDENGAVWAWGNNVFGQLGVGSCEDANIPQRAAFDGHAEVISAGLQESAWIDENNHLWTVGKHGSVSQVSVPQVTEESTKFYTVSAGNKFGLAVDNEGNVWGWGVNEFGQLGNPQSDDQSMNKSDLEQRISVVECGGTHSLLITNKCEVMASGNNSRGQLGNCGINNTEKFFKVIG